LVPQLAAIVVVAASSSKRMRKLEVFGVVVSFQLQG
jgi:hypothetical protein